MSALVVRIYQYMRSHKILSILSFLLITAVLGLLLAQQTYKEDISDFLPLNNKYNKALKVYQEISGANKILAIFQYKDSTVSEPATLINAIDRFVSILEKDDQQHVIQDLTYQINMEKVAEVSDFVYNNMPYFLTESDYERFDSLLSQPDYIPSQIAKDKQMLMFPVSGLLSGNLQRDPLNLFTPVVSQLQRSQANVSYENYDDYIFSADMKRAIVLMSSPYGASETEKNTQLLGLLQKSADKTENEFQQVDIHFIGGPVIAVGNSNQIKTDSLISILLAVGLIIALLFFVFRSFRNLLLIVISIAWGWLFAMGVLALMHDRVSVIVIGISSVIVGIAVNYPLHLIAHLSHTPNVKSALKEIVMPLVVGNITTVGAFLALLPLESVALRDLGMFSALLLIGTILFVLIFLPHLVKVKEGRSSHNIFSKVSDISLENKRWAVYIITALTLVLGYFSMDTTFDANMSHINYMTDAQKADMAYFQKLTSEIPSEQSVYIVSSDTSLDGALNRSKAIQPMLQKMKTEGFISDIQGCSQFLCSQEEQKKRLELWNSFVAEHAETIEAAISKATSAEGFEQGTFDEFSNMLHSDYEQKDHTYFNLLASTVFTTNITADSISHTYNIIDVVKTKPQDLDNIVNKVDESASGQYAFDVNSMNTSIATRLSDDFNYIGWACGLIVFFFLWFSLGSLELAMLSFLPMALSWVWILGIMSLFGIQFNVVNVILATFIFGQGDDYTIFMTEGCQYEYAYRRKMLASYKNSIIISALIMFIGIGTLILAKHPALHALAEVTIIGMFSVVLMAYLFPPLIFKWLVSDTNGYRQRPITLKSLLYAALGRKRPSDPASIVRDRYRYKGSEINIAVKKSLSKRAEWMRDIDTSSSTITLQDDSWGERALLIALKHPEKQVVAKLSDEDRLCVAQHSAEGITHNLKLHQ